MTPRVVGHIVSSLLQSGSKQVLVIEVAPGITEMMQMLIGNTLVFTRYATLDSGVLARILPDLVLAPLLGQTFDIMDVAALLVRSGYSGSLCAVTKRLPNPAAVLAELRAHCIGLHIELLEYPQFE